MSAISSEIIRGYIDTMILFVLTSGDSYGYEISKRIRETSREEYVMKETTLYSAFSRLEKSGYIVSYPGGVTFGKPRTYYRMTPEGRAHYFEKCREWEITKNVISNFIIKDDLSDGND